MAKGVVTYTGSSFYHSITDGEDQQGKLTMSAANGQPNRVTLLQETAIGNLYQHLSLKDARKLRAQLGRAIRESEARAAGIISAACKPVEKPAEKQENSLDLDRVRFADAVNKSRPDENYDGERASEAKVKAMDHSIGELDAEMERIKQQLGKGVHVGLNNCNDPSSDIFIIG
jgi:hypothetical protein